MHKLNVLRNSMFKPVIRMAVAAAVVGFFVFATFAAPKANIPDNTRALAQALAKGDRLPLHVKGSACSKHGWPNFEQNCQFDFRNPVNEARTVRVIALR